MMRTDLWLLIISLIFIWKGTGDSLNCPETPFRSACGCACLRLLGVNYSSRLYVKNTLVVMFSDSKNDVVKSSCSSQMGPEAFYQLTGLCWLLNFFSIDQYLIA